jgi:hypothetical protein
VGSFHDLSPAWVLRWRRSRVGFMPRHRAMRPSLCIQVGVVALMMFFEEGKVHRMLIDGLQGVLKLLIMVMLVALMSFVLAAIIAGGRRMSGGRRTAVMNGWVERMCRR